MNLFAELRVEADKIKRISLSERVRKELTENFSELIRVYVPEQEDLIISFEENMDYKLEEDEIFVIENFEMKQELVEYIKNPLTVNLLIEDDYENLKYLFWGNIERDNVEIAFILFDKTKIVKSDRGKFWIEYRGNTFSKVERKAIAIDMRIDAFFKNRSLYFKSFRNVKIIFGSLIERYFREATDEEVGHFNKTFFGDGVSIPDKFIDQTSRKLIWAIQRNNIYHDLTQIANIGKEKFGLQIELTNDGKLTVPDNKRDFKRLLRLLNDDLLESPLTQEKYETNSKRRITIESRS